MFSVFFVFSVKMLTDWATNPRQFVRAHNFFVTFKVLRTLRFFGVSELLGAITRIHKVQ